MNKLIFATLLIGYCSAYHLYEEEAKHQHYAEPTHYATKAVHHGEKYHGPEHYPVITKEGVPLDTPEVQHARAEHFAAIAKAQAEGHHYAPEYHHHEPEYHHEEPAYHHEEPEYHHEEPHHETKYHGPEHYPVITKEGVPLDTPEVQHATAEHLAAHAAESAKHHGWEQHDEYAHGYHH